MGTRKYDRSQYKRNSQDYIAKYYKREWYRNIQFQKKDLGIITSK